VGELARLHAAQRTLSYFTPLRFLAQRVCAPQDRPEDMAIESLLPHLHMLPGLYAQRPSVSAKTAGNYMRRVRTTLCHAQVQSRLSDAGRAVLQQQLQLLFPAD
jgi:hypothetical protein